MREAIRSLLVPWDPRRLASDIDHIRFAVGALAAPQARSATTMREAEFRAFSQFGEDGIIQWLLARVQIGREVFVELGAGDYRESNTRFLLEYNDWRGLIVDAGRAPGRYLAWSGLLWRHSVKAVSAFVTAENINELLAEVAGDIALLSVDIDGMDYWVLKELTAVRPRIVVVEYNSVWGPKRTVSVPYDREFKRSAAHWSNLYFGASLGAFCHLLSERGYRFVGSNSTGHNAFFVQQDFAGDLPSIRPADGWVESRFRESRGRDGRLTYIDAHHHRRRAIADLPLVDVVSGESLRVADLGASA